MKQIKQTTMNVGNHKKHVLSKLFKTTKNSWNMKLQLKYIFRARPYLTMLSAIAPQISLLSSQQMISIMLFVSFTEGSQASTVILPYLCTCLCFVFPKGCKHCGDKGFIDHFHLQIPVLAHTKLNKYVPKK